MATFVIAEAGVNHNGDAARALELVDAAADADADAVKFQTFKAARLVSGNAPKAGYALQTTDAGETQFEMIRKLELDEAAHRAIIERCQMRGIEFMSTPFDAVSATWLAEAFDVKRLKIPSGEIVNPLLLFAAARTGKPVILSTGMSTLDEIEAALGVLAYGYIGGGAPNSAAFAAAFADPAGQSVLRDRVTLLHCTTEYPAPFETVNLKAMATIAERFGLAVGYSDHTEGITVAIAAVALGAVVLEKHFTLDRALPGPDHTASLEPVELDALVKSIRQIDRALGTAKKVVTEVEVDNRMVVRGSLVAAREIKKGVILGENDLTVKRPGGGICPMRYWDYVGSEALQNYKRDELI
jgi:N-acetylneuraminate synthase